MLVLRGSPGGAVASFGHPVAAGALVHAVAVLGDGASLAEAAGQAGLAEEEAAIAADLLVALAIMKPGAGHASWRQPLDLPFAAAHSDGVRNDAIPVRLLNSC